MSKFRKLQKTKIVDFVEWKAFLISFHLYPSSDKIEQLSKNYTKHKPEFLSLLDEATNLFHPNHEVISGISVWLVPTLCRSPEQTPEKISSTELSLKRDLCKHVLEVLGRVNPGIGRKRGTWTFRAETNQSRNKSRLGPKFRLLKPKTKARPGLSLSWWEKEPWRSRLGHQNNYFLED